MKIFNLKNINNLQIGNVFIRYIVTYAAILLFPCLVLGLFFFIRATAQIKNNALNAQQYEVDALSLSLSKEFNSLMAQTSLINIDITTAEMSKLNESIVFRPFKWQNDKYNQTKIIWELSQFKNSSPLTRECLLLYRQYDQIFSTSTSGEFDSFFENRLKLEPWDLIEDILYNAQGSRLVPVRVSDVFKTAPYDAILYIIPFNLDKMSTKDVVIVYIIPADLLNSWSNVFLGIQQYRINLLDANHQVLLSYGAFPGTGMQFSDVFSNGNVTNKQFKVNGQTVSLFKSYAESPKLDLVLESPWDKTMQQLYAFRNLTTIIVLITMFSGFILVIIFSFLSYNPLKKILYSLREQIPAFSSSSKNNEYQQLNNAITTTLVQNKNLEEQINIQSRNIYKEVLTKLLTGIIRYDRLDKTFNITGNLPGPYYNVLVFRVKEEQSGNSKQESLRDSLPSLMKASIGHETVEMQNYHCITIIFSFNQEQSAHWQKLVNDVYMDTMRANKLCAGSSDLHDNIGSLSQCMIEAFLSLQYMEAQKKVGIQFFSNSFGKDFRLDLTPEPLLNLFTQSLKNGDETHCLALFEMMLDAIEANQNPITMQIQYYHICDAILKIIREFYIEGANIEFDFLTLFQNIDIFRLNMKRFIKDVCQCVNKNQDSYKKDNIVSMAQYINENYLDPNISLNQLAVKYGMSMSMVSVLFRKHTGIGFNDYIVKKRLETAQHMLSTTSLSVHEIATVVGYNNESHFIKTFKMLDGMTPAQYRKHLAAVNEATR